MGTTIRAELSEKNPYWIEKHRYYELKHFCLQYPIWKKSYSEMDGFSRMPRDMVAYNKHKNDGDPTAKCAEMREFYLERMRIVEQTAIMADGDLADFILKAVTEGMSYEYLKVRLEIPCCRDTYYDRYRKFFWLLDKERENVKCAKFTFSLMR